MTAKHCIKLSVKQLNQIASWIATRDLADTNTVEISMIETGIGPWIEAKVELTEGEGIWRDFTDHESW